MLIVINNDLHNNVVAVDLAKPLNFRSIWSAVCFAPRLIAVENPAATTSSSLSDLRTSMFLLSHTQMVSCMHGREDVLDLVKREAGRPAGACRGLRKSARGQHRYMKSAPLGNPNTVPSHTARQPQLVLRKRCCAIRKSVYA